MRHKCRTWTDNLGIRPHLPHLVFHSGHTILKSKFQDFPGHSRAFLGKFQDIGVLISRTIPGHLKEIVLFQGQNSQIPGHRLPKFSILYRGRGVWSLNSTYAMKGMSRVPLPSWRPVFGTIRWLDWKLCFRILTLWCAFSVSEYLNSSTRKCTQIHQMKI